MELIELRNNYKSLNYSIIDIDLHLIKISIYPIFLCLMTIFSSLIMIATKYTLNTSLKILFGLFFSVIIYYLNNFSYVLGSTKTTISFLFNYANDIVDDYQLFDDI